MAFITEIFGKRLPGSTTLVLPEKKVYSLNLTQAIIDSIKVTGLRFLHRIFDLIPIVNDVDSNRKSFAVSGHNNRPILSWFELHYESEALHAKFL